MIFVAALMLAQAAAPAPATPARAAGQKPTAKLECRMVMETGSRIPTRVCRLNKEWELLARDAQDDLNSSRNGHGVGMNSGDPR
jgi:hypothetical protein